MFYSNPVSDITNIRSGNIVVQNFSCTRASGQQETTSNSSALGVRRTKSVQTSPAACVYDSSGTCATYKQQHTTYKQQQTTYKQQTTTAMLRTCRWCVPDSAASAPASSAKMLETLLLALDTM
jgi:hypothetical protein